MQAVVPTLFSSQESHWETLLCLWFRIEDGQKTVSSMYKDVLWSLLGQKEEGECFRMSQPIS